MSEWWLPIEGFPSYEVSDLGRVRRIGGRVLSVRGLRLGYPSVQLCENGHRTSMLVHRLVAAAFIDPCPHGLEVNHVDGVKTNNRSENLEYVTRQENEIHAYRELGFRAASGEQNGNAKLTLEQVREIRLRARALDRPSYSAIARDYGVTGDNVRAIAGGRSWADA
jgi:hypothetical protein